MGFEVYHGPQVVKLPNGVCEWRGRTVAVAGPYERLYVFSDGLGVVLFQKLGLGSAFRIRVRVIRYSQFAFEAT